MWKYCSLYRWRHGTLLFVVARLPVDDEAEFFLDTYLELEQVAGTGAGQTIECTLLDGGIQIGFTIANETADVDLLLVPVLNGEFAKRIQFSLKTEFLLQMFRPLVSHLVNAANDT